MVSRFLTTLWIAVFLACGGCESTPRAPAHYSSLTPGPVIRGGLLGDATRVGVAGPFTALRGPVAVAAMGPDVYVADTGLGLLLRVDQVANRLTPFGPRGVQPGTRLAADVDGSLYVLDPASRRLQRFARDGRLLQSFPTDPTIASLRDLALDHTRGRILGVDALNRQLVAFRPLGASSELLPLYGEPRNQLASFDALTAAPEALYALDGRCRCIARLAFDGRVLGTFGQERLVRPERIAADRFGRLFVADGGDRAIKAFRDGVLEETVPYAGLGLLEATDLAYADGWLYVADAPGSQVRMLRVQPPRKAQP
ncbi:MAG: NHL repeat-containing protein [Burkholderiales bacterium]